MDRTIGHEVEWVCIAMVHPRIVQLAVDFQDAALPDGK